MVRHHVAGVQEAKSKQFIRFRFLYNQSDIFIYTTCNDEIHQIHSSGKQAIHKLYAVQSSCKDMLTGRFQDSRCAVLWPRFSDVRWTAGKQTLRPKQELVVTQTLSYQINRVKEFILAVLMHVKTDYTTYHRLQVGFSGVGRCMRGDLIWAACLVWAK